MAEWKVSKFFPKGAQKVEWQPLWILWTSKVHRKRIILSIKWEIGTFERITMSLALFQVLPGD